MSTAVLDLPRRRSDLVIRPSGEGGQYVVKSPIDGSCFQIGEVEHFLLMQLDGEQSAREVRDAFKAKFGERLGSRDLQAYLEAVKPLGLLELTEAELAAAQAQAEARRSPDDEDDEDSGSSKSRFNVFYFRKSLFNPDRILTALEPPLRFVWTRGFFVASALMMLLALNTIASNGADVVAGFSEAFRWETVLLAWVTVIITTMIHEFAHGLTCKHHGGEVREIGVLFLLLTPCFYCNVTDTWLFPKKSHRLWVMAAGGYCDLCLWALAVFVWRITVPDSLINYLSFVVLTVCGARGAVNLNPLLRLDGYYLLSDFLGIPNLRRRSSEYFKGHLRWFLWGAKPPERDPRGTALLAYGLLSWSFAIGFLNYVCWQIVKYASDSFGMLGLCFTGLLLIVGMKRVFTGFFKSELLIMLKSRRQRTLAWLGGIAAVLAVLFLVPMNHYATGDFVVRAGSRHEVAAPVSGFISRIHVQEGSRVAKGDPLIELSSSELTTHIATKEAELRGIEANLAKLRLGARPELIHATEEKVSRLRHWVGLGQQEVERARQAHAQELKAVAQRIERTKTQWEFARQSYAESERLYQLRALAGAQLKSEQVQLALLASQIEEAEADRRVKEANGVRSIEAELARREQELAGAESELALLKAGTRPEEIAAEVARQEQLQQQLQHLNAQREKLTVRATVSGVVATPRLQDKLGQLVAQGLPICVIEDGARSRVEISISEDMMSGIRPGQSVNLKARALPFQTYEAAVERIAPAAIAVEAKHRNVLVVHCEVDNEDGQLCTGMSGFGRVFQGQRTLGAVFLAKSLGYVRTEFWW